jgi:enoyl-CoA hydratase
MGYNNIKLEIEGGLAVISITRPKALNALNDETLTELGQAFTELEQDETTRVVIITGDGEKAFVAGADIKELQQADSVGAKRISEKGHEVFAQIETSDLISIAAVNGFALVPDWDSPRSVSVLFQAMAVLRGSPGWSVMAKRSSCSSRVTW